MRSKKGKETTRIILQSIAWAGVIVIASTSPYFLPKIIPKLIKYSLHKLKSRERKRNFCNTFYYLRKRGLIKVDRRGKQVYISLTREGKRKAKKYQIDNLKIKKPKKWDKKWRILIFDVQDTHRMKREVLRGKLKELGLYQLQKSVWVHPYSFQLEMKTLRSFLGLNHAEMRIITASDIEGDEEVRSFFNLL